jgi:hypothetical protein
MERIFIYWQSGLAKESSSVRRHFLGYAGELAKRSTLTGFVNLRRFFEEEDALVAAAAISII